MNNANLIKEKQTWVERTGWDSQNMSQSYLRASSLLSAQNSIKFQIQENNTPGTGLSTDKRLALNDGFIITHIGLCLMQADPTDDASVANARLHTFLNSVSFAKVNDANLAQIYNGALQFQINRVDYFPALDVRSFERVDFAQAGQTNYATGKDGQPNGLYGYYPVGGIKVDGQQTLDFTVNLPASLDMSGAAGVENYAVLLLKGYLGTNQATNIKAK